QFDAPGLPYQSWRTLQPTIATYLDSPGGKLVALTGHGGLGKSVLLDQWGRELMAQGRACIWIDAGTVSVTQLAGLSAALALGAFSCRASGKRLTLCVDALEESALDRASFFPNLSSLAGSEVDVVLTCRSTVWTSLRDPGRPAPGWTALSVEPWPP